VALLATGSEVSLALDAATLLEKEGVRARVVSMPCWELFAAQAPEAREAVFGGCAVRVGVEAGVSLGWHAWVGPGGGLVTLDRFGASAPGADLMREFGFTPEHVADVARRCLAASEREP
jgi:transketolase